MKKIISAFLISCILSAVLFAQAKEKYISPNNDGVQDELVIPLNITDKRYVASWSLVILDENRNPVRTIGNKIALPTKVGIKGFFKQIASVKEGVIIPETVTWNGALDSGETAPDGKYYYYVSATDDNGNEGRTKEYSVIVDTVAPDVDVVQPVDKIFGEGAKSSFKISQSGSVEDEWIGRFRAVDGTIAKTFKWTNAEPAAFQWNGTSDDGTQVSDGVYSYEITATDRAGNVSPYTTIQNIIYSAEKPATNIFVDGSRYFSPETESKKSSIVFKVTIPVPEAKTGNSLTDWTVTIYNDKGSAVRSFSKAKDGNVPPTTIIFDGKSDSGNILPNGTYQAKVTASYLNGYIPPVIASPKVVLDTVKPEAQFVVSDKVFGSGAKRSVEISLSVDNKTGAPIPEWTGKILSADGKTVKTFEFGEFPPDSISWNGIDDKGNLSPKGDYLFALSAEDLAGNKGVENKSDMFTFDTTEASLLLAASDSAFSPNGNKVKDTITFTPVSKGTDVTKYTFQILDSAGKSVYTKTENKKLPTTFVWNGKDDAGILCIDGKYSAKLAIDTANGSSSNATTSAFSLDTVAPNLSASSQWTDFSPDEDGNQDVLPVKISSCSSEKSWLCEVKNSKNETVRHYTWKGIVKDFEWDGRDESGNIAPDGVYSLVFSSTDEAGNSFSTSMKNLTLDARETKAYIITEFEGISPNGDNVLDTQKFEIKATVTENITSWNFEIRQEDGKAVRSWSEKDSANLPANIVWDGYKADGTVGEGTFTATLSVSYKKGNRVSTVSSPFVCTATPPQLKVQTAPEYFSPDNDGTDDDLFIRLTGSTKAKIKNWSFTINDPLGKPFWTTAGKSQITERIVWDGLSNVQKNKSTGKAETVQSAMDYPYEFVVTDNLGMTSKVSGVIPVDVLVIRDGNVLKMAVPSIIFLSDSSEFQKPQGNLTDEQVAKNMQVLNRITDILKKFKDYKVEIVGHANRVSDNLDEETVDNMMVWGRALMPLSKERADAIKNYLIKKGVSASNLVTDGKGGTEPVADPKDKDNNWKNRRVEFILQK